MALWKYLRCKEDLPDPKGSLSSSISSRAIASANREVEKALEKDLSKNKKRGPYRK